LRLILTTTKNQQKADKPDYRLAGLPSVPATNHRTPPRGNTKKALDFT